MQNVASVKKKRKINGNYDPDESPPETRSGGFFIAQVQ